MVHIPSLRKILPPLSLIFIWIIMISVINPMGDFPLNDDWSYGRAVKTLLEKGRLQFTDWTGMTLIAQVLWGYLFCLPLGFSFTALRISTLTLGMAGILGTYGLLKESGTGPRTAFLGAMVMAVNPLYYSLSFTFMTDIPFFTLGMLSLYFFIQGIIQNKSCLWRFALVLSCATRRILLAHPGHHFPKLFPHLLNQVIISFSNQFIEVRPAVFILLNPLAGKLA